MNQPIETNSIAETLCEIGAKHGNAIVADIVAAYASTLTDVGRNRLIRAIGECYEPARFEEYGL